MTCPYAWTHLQGTAYGKKTYRAVLSPKAKLLLAIGTRDLEILFKVFQNFNIQRKRKALINNCKNMS